MEKTPICIAELTYRYLDSVKDSMKPSTYAFYENYALHEITPRIGTLSAESFDKKQMEEFLQLCTCSRNGKGERSSNTMYMIEEILRAMFLFGEKHGLISEMPFGKVKYKRERTCNDASILSKWEIQKLLHEAQQAGIKQEIQVLLPLYLGLNLSELCGLKWEDVDLEAGKVFIHRCVKRIMKTNTEHLKPTMDVQAKTSTAVIDYELDKREQRTFRLPMNIRNLLKKAYSERKHLDSSCFVATLDYKYAEGRTLQYRLKTLGNKAGIEHLSYRCLRDTFAAASLYAGANVVTLANILGINIQAVCERYREWIVYDDSFLEKLG